MKKNQLNAELSQDHNENEFKKATLICDEFPTIDGEIMVRGTRGTVKIGKNVKINSAFWANSAGGTQTCFWLMDQSAVIEIGDNSGCSNVVLASKTSITIGKNVFLGGGVRIFDTDFHAIDLQDRLDDVNTPTKPVIIEDGCFIGASAIILKGVTVGKESVVGAGSVVAKNIPSGEIWAGNPAKFIKKLND